MSLTLAPVLMVADVAVWMWNVYVIAAAALR